MDFIIQKHFSYFYNPNERNKMHKKIIGLIFLLLAGILTGSAQKRSFDASKNLDTFNSIYKELDLFFVDSLNAQKTIRTGIDAILSSLDPYTVYYASDETKSLKLMITGKYAGIGSVIRYYKKADRVVIDEPYEGMPAALAGVKPGDIILAIDGKDTGKKGSKNTSDFVAGVSDQLKGEPGTTFILKVQRPGIKEPLSFKITRKTVKMPAIPYYAMLPNHTAYINLSSFTEGCAQEVRRAFVELKEQGATSLVFDLRDNGGGSMSEAIDIVSMFVPKGTEVVSTKGKMKAASSTYKTTKEPIDTKIPIAVLVNGGTASASEITSGALQDEDRAVIIGNRTYGKGLVQVTRDMPYGGVLKVTASKYYIPSGRCIQAIDYSSHRYTDGVSTRIPDSLTHVFKTRLGRDVRDGGGITPDQTVKKDSMATMLYYMITSDELFDYVTNYVEKHPSIAPADKFGITETDYADFEKYMEGTKFSYDAQSGKALNELKKIAKAEGYLNDAQNEFNALEQKLKPNLQKDLERNKKDIKNIINSEIIKRYYYQKGAIQYALKDDKDLKEAFRILGNTSEYNSILTPIKKESKK